MSRFYDVLKQAGRFEPRTGSGEVVVDAPVVMPPHPGAQPDHAAASAKLAEQPVAPEAPGESFTAEHRRSKTAESVHTLINGRVRVLRHTVDPTIVENYRRLRTKLLQERATAPFRVMMVASGSPQEGKTVTALNLALSFSMLPDFKVLLVDGDLRKGTLGKWLGVEERAGLSDAIEGAVPIDDVILRSDELPIRFVLRGTSKVPSGELLNSPRAEAFFRHVAERFDLVILDSPPLNIITDGHLLARCCDGILLVARAFSTTTKSFEKMAQELHSYRVLGAVLNGAARSESYRQYNGYSGDKQQ